jgi:hypothetical protein
MLLLPLSHRPTVANDNGEFAPRRVRAPVGILVIAAQLAGRVSLRYLAQGVFVIGNDHAREQQAA